MSTQIINQGFSAADLNALDLIADIQFNEPLSSAAINRKFYGLFPEGVYRGFNAVPAGGLTVSVGDDPVNVAVVNVDGFMINVHSLRPIKLEIPVGREVYGIIEANYAIGRKTTQVDINASIKAADLRIINPNELRKNHVIVFTANLPVGTKEVTKEHILTDKRQQSSALDETANRVIQMLDEHVKNADPHTQYAKKESPTFTGTPKAPTPPDAAKDTEIATAAFVLSRIAHLVGSAPDVMDTLQEISAALNNNPNFATEILQQLAGKMSKSENGADIPDKSKFMSNLGVPNAIADAVKSVQDKVNNDTLIVHGTALSVDLNTLGSINHRGVYFQPTTLEAKTSLNYPVEEAGTLLVTPSAYGCQQEYTSFNTCRKFCRGLATNWNGANGPWGKWVEVGVSLPVGIPFPWPSNTVPAGWAIMQGQAFDKAKCPQLALAYPSGVLPDMRGQTIKGNPNGRGLLSYEADGIKSHNHSASAMNTDLGNKGTSGFDYGNKSTTGGGDHQHAYTTFAREGGGSWGFYANASNGGDKLTTVSGGHAHTVYIGAHSHTVYIGAHGHVVNVAAAGNPENTVKNISFHYIARLA